MGEPKKKNSLKTNVGKVKKKPLSLPENPPQNFPNCLSFDISLVHLRAKVGRSLKPINRFKILKVCILTYQGVKGNLAMIDPAITSNLISQNCSY